MKLKTLKDIHNRWLDEGMDSAAFIFIDELKEEAIKWVKKGRKLEDKAFDKKDSNAACFHAGGVRIIKMLHNISEEDLK